MKPKVMVLGSYHMSSEKDLAEQNGTELRPEREQELEELL